MKKIEGGWKNVPGNLAAKTELSKRGLKPVGQPVACVWSHRTWISLYDVSETVAKKKATEKQLASIAHARQVYKEARTCKRCGDVKKEKIDLDENGVCWDCTEQERHEAWLIHKESETIQRFRAWVKNKSEYLVLDTETTGLESHDEIIDIAVVDLDQKVLFESFVKPDADGRNEFYYQYDRKKHDAISAAPRWPEVWQKLIPLIAGKTLLIYNDSFDVGMIERNCDRHGLIPPELKSACVMRAYAPYHGAWSEIRRDFRWVKLYEAVKEAGVESYRIDWHNAKSDALVTSMLICAVAAKKQTEEGGIFYEGEAGFSTTSGE